MAASNVNSSYYTSNIAPNRCNHYSPTISRARGMAAHPSLIQLLCTLYSPNVFDTTVFTRMYPFLIRYGAEA